MSLLRPLPESRQLSITNIEEWQFAGLIKKKKDIMPETVI
jgi:hypothetical protein